jgi:hypothetical protein
MDVYLQRLRRVDCGGKCTFLRICAKHFLVEVGEPFTIAGVIKGQDGEVAAGDRPCHKVDAREVASLSVVEIGKRAIGHSFVEPKGHEVNNLRAREP